MNKMLLKFICIVCLCITIVYFTWLGIILIGVLTAAYLVVKITLQKYGKRLYNYFENLFK